VSIFGYVPDWPLIFTIGGVIAGGLAVWASVAAILGYHATRRTEKIAAESLEIQRRQEADPLGNTPVDDRELQVLIMIGKGVNLTYTETPEARVWEVGSLWKVTPFNREPGNHWFTVTVQTLIEKELLKRDEQGHDRFLLTQTGRAVALSGRKPETEEPLFFES
jgi:hypothetical protein